MDNKKFSEKNKSTLKPVVVGLTNKPAKPQTMMRAYQILAADGIVEFHSFCDLKGINDADREVIIFRYDSAHGNRLRLL